MRVLYESGIVQPGASSRPHPSLKPLIRGAHGWGGRGAMVSVEEEAVAVSPGCYLLGRFESPRHSLTRSRTISAHIKSQIIPLILSSL